MQKFLTDSQLRQLVANFKDKNEDNAPVVKFFGGSATWLFNEYNPDNECFFGLCDLGHGAELGYVDSQELKGLKIPPFGLGVERDYHFSTTEPMSYFIDKAKQDGGIYV